MVSGPYLMGIDGGTESVRVGIFDREGTPIAFASRTYALKHPRPGWAEQDPDEWWSSLVVAVKEVMGRNNIAPKEIAGIFLDCTTCTVVALTSMQTTACCDRLSSGWIFVPSFKQHVSP